MKNQSTEKQLRQSLKEIIDIEGLDYLSTYPYEVYLELLQTGIIDECSARLILITLLAGTAEKGMHEKEGLSEYIQEECCLNKVVSDQLAHLYRSLFSEENCEDWNQKINGGFSKFCEEQWHFDLEAHGAWYSDNVHVDADCYASMYLMVWNSDALRRALNPLLQENPFTSETEIHSYISKKLEEELSADFDQYVSCDDYYPPVAEDYDENFFDLISEFCDRYGLLMVSCEYSGETSDYIPNQYPPECGEYQRARRRDKVPTIELKSFEA